MSIEHLPAELILLITSQLLSESSIAALARSNRRLHGICNPYLYKYNVLHFNSSALDWAAQNGRMNTLQNALDAGAPLPKKQPTGEVREQGPSREQFGRQAPHRFGDFQSHPISLASKYGHTDIVRYMIDRGVKSNISDPDGFTLLALAAIHGHTSLAEYLLDIGAQQGIRSLVGHRPVWLAAFQGHVDVVDMLVSTPMRNEDDLDKDEPDKEELMTEALFAAVLGGRAPVVQLLFTHEVQVNVFGEFKKTPLFMAAANGMGDLVSLLLAYGADPNLIFGQQEWHSPLTIAVSEGHEEVVRILVEGTMRFHRTRALTLAVAQGNIRVAKILLQNGALPQFYSSEIPKTWGHHQEWVQPLLFAVQRGNLELTELLMQYGADVNVECTERPVGGADKLYDRALFWAVEKSDEAMVNLLLGHGADPDIDDLLDQPPLTYAIYCNNEGIVRSLLDHGANPYRAADVSGRKLLFFWQMKQSIFLQLQEAEIKWSKEHH
ncbi:uncharacterized protein N7479_001387 [Penicillium vulpinum]|uniref:uncharacterized protein n=1 Tax=Penicillium vulpinum TaxID=29845 RepID=UPI0025474CD7|nr:uncharacterized protein N7479_001387 [Penicillium vulpinum]KAJ5971469.1 hypothetical protein N7479_001387 [Penicillium vulpinum]